MADNQQRELADNEVRLSDGRIVVMRETTAADEAVVAQMLGDKVSLQGAGIQVLTQANALKAIESIDGEPLKKEDGSRNLFRTYNDFLSAARQFKSKDMNKIIRKYAEMNLEADEDNPLA
jgi:hypothetical protein